MNMMTPEPTVGPKPGAAVVAVEAPKRVQAPEGVPGNLQGTIEGGNIGNVWVTVTPTQVRRPWRSTARSVFQMVVALASLLPFVAAGVYTDPEQAPYIVGQVLVVAGAITRVMALPQVETFLRAFLPFLAAAPRETYTDDR